MQTYLHRNSISSQSTALCLQPHRNSPAGEKMGVKHCYTHEFCQNPSGTTYGSFKMPTNGFAVEAPRSFFDQLWDTLMQLLGYEHQRRAYPDASGK